MQLTGEMGGEDGLGGGDTCMQKGWAVARLVWISSEGGKEEEGSGSAEGGGVSMGMWGCCVGDIVAPDWLTSCLQYIWSCRMRLNTLE